MPLPNLLAYDFSPDLIATYLLYRSGNWPLNIDLLRLDYKGVRLGCIAIRHNLIQTTFGQVKSSLELSGVPLTLLKRNSKIFWYDPEGKLVHIANIVNNTTTPHANTHSIYTILAYDTFVVITSSLSGIKWTYNSGVLKSIQLTSGELLSCHQHTPWSWTITLASESHGQPIFQFISNLNELKITTSVNYLEIKYGKLDDNIVSIYSTQTHSTYQFEYTDQLVSSLQCNEHRMAIEWVKLSPSERIRLRMPQLAYLSNFAGRTVTHDISSAGPITIIADSNTTTAFHEQTNEQMLKVIKSDSKRTLMLSLVHQLE